MNNQASKILDLTSGGLLVFTHYMGERCLSKKFCNPLRKDSHPSCRLYQNKDEQNNLKCFFMDFANRDYRGDCFWFVGKLCSLNPATEFIKILQTIDKDLSLGVFDDTHLASSKTRDLSRKLQQKFESMDKSTVQSFTLRTKSFSKSELGYWGAYGIDESTLSRYNVRSVDSCTFVKKDGKDFSIFGSDELPVFGYCFGQGKGYKFYKPRAKNRFLYAGTLPHPYVFGLDQLPNNGDVLFITGGEKDVMSLAAHGFNAIAFNSETAKLPEDTLLNLSQRFQDIVLLFDSDETGIHESKARIDEYKGKICLKRLQLPLSGSKQEKDISDYFKMGRSSTDLRQLLNNCV